MEGSPKSRRLFRGDEPGWREMKLRPTYPPERVAALLDRVFPDVPASAACPLYAESSEVLFEDWQGWLEHKYLSWLADWRELNPRSHWNYASALIHLRPEPLRRYLPAYLITAMRPLEECEAVDHMLAHYLLLRVTRYQRGAQLSPTGYRSTYGTRPEDFDECFGPMTGGQKAAVAKALRTTAHLAGLYRRPNPTIEQPLLCAIDVYWAQFG